VPSAEVRWEIAYESLAALEESQAWKNWPAVKAFGLDGFRFHDLRHTCAAMLIQQGAHPRAIMEGSEPLNEAEYIVVTNADLSGANLEGTKLTPGDQPLRDEGQRGHNLAGGVRPGSRRSDLRLGRSGRPRTGRETSRNNANQREPVINQNGRLGAVFGCLCRSAVWGASIWGTEGPEFKSRQPDRKSPRSLDQEAPLAVLLVGP